MPSITIKGSLLHRVPTPRIRLVCLAPGSPLVVVICTPEKLPCKAWSGLAIGALLISFALTEEIAPVRSFCSCSPYPMTTTSSDVIKLQNQAVASVLQPDSCPRDFLKTSAPLAHFAALISDKLQTA